MSWDDDSGITKRNEYLQHLVDDGYIDGREAGIALQVIEGKKTLSSKQEFVYRRHIEQEFMERTCRICGGEVDIGDLQGCEETGMCGECDRSEISFMKHD